MILEQIKSELELFDRDIVIIDKWKFNQKRAIKNSTLYYNSIYENGEFDDDGFKVYFYNIVKAACGTTTKSIDIDMKDIQFLTAPGGEWLKTWFYERDFKNWAKKKEFGKILNFISETLPQLGSVVLKKVGDMVEPVHLINLVNEQNADTLAQSNYVTEIHLYTKLDFIKVAKKQGWETKKILELYKDSKDQYIRVYERYGLCEDGEYKLSIVADVPSDLRIDPDAFYRTTNTTVLFEAPFNPEDLPYIEIHLSKIKGRWLGVSIPEQLRDPQIRINEIFNQRARNSYWSGLRLWQTRDPGAARNLLRAVEDGDILQLDDDLKPVDTRDLNLSNQEAETAQWKTNVQEQTFSYDVVRGERTPAGTPLGSAQLSASLTLSYFDQIKENIGLDIKSLIYKLLPEFKKQANKEHVVKIVGEDLDKLNEIKINTEMHSRLLDFVETNGYYPGEDEIQMMREMVEEVEKSKNEQHLSIPEGWYKDVEDDIDIIITGESIDTRVKVANLTTALQMMSVDPTVLQDPVKKRVFAAFLEQGGLKLADIESKAPRNTQVVSPMGQVGGGVSAATASQPQGTQEMAI